MNPFAAKARPARVTPHHPTTSPPHPPTHPHTRTPTRRLFAWAVLLTLAAAPLMACWGPELESVHFHSYRPDFLKMPPPWPGPPDVRALVPGVTDLRYREQLVGPEPHGATSSKLLSRQARAAEARGAFREAAALWGLYRTA